MKKLLTILLMEVAAIGSLWSNSIDSLLHVLDAALIHRQLYEQKQSPAPEVDGAFVSIMQWIDNGFISDAEGALDAIRPQLSSSAEEADYYRCRIKQNEHLHRLHHADTLEYTYSARIQEYRDSLCRLLPDGDVEKTYYQAWEAMERKAYRTAAQGLVKAGAEASGRPLLLARIYEMAVQVNRHLNHPSKADEYLIRKAILCVKNKIDDYSPLVEVARMYMREGHPEEARKYLDYAQDYAGLVRSPLPAIELTRALGELKKMEHRQQVTEKHRLYLFFSMLSVMTIILLFSIRKINRQMHVIAEAKQKMEKLYADLEKKKNDLEAMNAELTTLTQELQVTNSQLSEASLLKEEYIGHFLKQCSEYLHKLQDYKKMVNRKIQAGQIDELFKQNNSKRIIQEESKELYRKFDIAFLKIFPHFVEQFNELLMPEERFVLDKDELLNTELRLFALVRLGIKDSSQIADFLGYSVTTIYTYRTRIKNKAMGNRDEFEENVMKIDL